MTSSLLGVDDHANLTKAGLPDGVINLYTAMVLKQEKLPKAP